MKKLVVVAALSTGLLVCLTLFMKPDLSEQFLQPHFSVNLPGVPPLPRSQPHLDWASQLHCNVIGNPKWAGRAVQPQRTREAHYFEEADYHYMDKLLKTGGMNISAMASYPLTDVMEDWEWDLYTFPPLTDPLNAGNETTSRLLHLNPKPVYRLGDLVHVRVDVYDGRGRPLSRGGDEVRVLLHEPEKKASLATEVTDLGNGSYYAAVPLLWTGSPLVRASLVYNRELIRAHHYARSAVKSIKNIAAGFKSFFASEATLCSPFPFLPGYSRFCNFTEENGGMPWYCGHPRNEALTCRHWWRSFDLEFVYPLPVTAAEEAWSTYVASRKPTARVPTEIKVKVTDSAKPSPQRHTTSPPVGKAANLQSWTSQAPRGYFLQNSWVSSSSTIPKFTKPQLLQCLKNTTVLFLGDSNARLAFKILAERVGCSLNTGEVKPSWHHPLSCEDNQNNIYMYWQIHALPFHAGKKSGCDRGDSKSAKQYIDEIPAEGKYLLMIHLNLHFPAHHYSVFTSQMHQVRASVERVLRRNPEVKVVVRGPHQALKGWVPLNGGDITAHVLTNIIKRLFEGLTDRVFFLQPWDMTVAIQNGPFHPSNLVNNAISDLFLAYACYSSEGGRKLL